MADLETITLKARDLKPYHYGIWCTIEGGQPFVNEIVDIRWSEGGTSLWLMLDTHNFIRVAPKQDIEVVPSKRPMCAEWTLPPPPKPSPVRPLFNREDVVAWMRSLPAGGIAELVAEAKVAEWALDPDGDHVLRAIGIGDVFEVARDNIGRWWLDDGSACWPVENEADGRFQAEARAVEAGWTIARPATPKEN